MIPSLKPIQNPRTVNRLFIYDSMGREVIEKYYVHDGVNSFTCKAEYFDGSIGVFEPYWALPIVYRSGELDYWGVLGKQRQQTISVNVASNHEKYKAGLYAWVFPPSKESESGNAEIPHVAISLDYSELNY